MSESITVIFEPESVPMCLLQFNYRSGKGCALFFRQLRLLRDLELNSSVFACQESLNVPELGLWVT